MNGINMMEASVQWMNRSQDQRFETLTALRESVEARRMRSRSVDVDCGKTEVKATDSSLTINGTMTPCEPTHWAFGQLSSLVGAPASYLRTLPNNMVVDCLNYGLQHAGRETVKFMTVTGDDNCVAPNHVNTLQAVTSTTYGRIWDADVVASVSRIVERTNWRFHNPLAMSLTGGPPKPSGLYASDRDCFMFMIDGGSILEAGPRVELNRGFITWNSETGSRTFGLMTFLFNRVCGNHIIWGATDVNKLIVRHTVNGPYRFDSEAAPALLAYAEASAKPEVDAIKRAQAHMLPGRKVEEVTEYIQKLGKFSRSELSNAIETAQKEEGDCRTLWHVIQGLTAYARGFNWVDARVDLERRAGSLLNTVKN